MNYFKHETAIIDEDCIIGDGTKIWHFTHVSKNVRIGKNCSLGQNVYIAPNITIGDNVKIQNGVSIYEGLIIEDLVFLGPHCVFTNDKFPRAFGDWDISKTVLRKGCSVGANSTIVCGVELGEYSMVGAGSVVTKNVEPKTLVYGNPAKFIKKFKNESTFKE
jgi:UDP-2-acetamido-3-amino-2,3-dideoxy-glucuronate N-acetyltransferase